MCKKLFFLIMVLIGTRVIAQDKLLTREMKDENRFIRTASSSEGNYLFLVDMSSGDSSIIKHTAKFKIERVKFDTIRNEVESTLINSGDAKTISSEGELKKYFTEASIAQMKTNFGLKSNGELVNYFNTHKSVNDYSLYYSTIEIKMALGHVFLDKNVKEGEVYVYKITRLDESKKEELWGVPIVKSKFGNPSLEYFHPKSTNSISYDSSVILSWKMPVNESISQSVKLPRSAYLKGSDEPFISPIPFSPKTFNGKVFLWENNSWKHAETLFPILNETKDTITYSYFKKANFEDYVAAYIVVQDEVYNNGQPSDTAFTYAVEQKSVPFVYSLNVKDIVNGVQLSWDALPTKPYITGIEITRYDSRDKLDSIAVLNPTDSTFADYAVELGQTYRYQVRAKFLPQLDIKQEVGAQGVGTFTKFSRPNPVYNVSVKNEGKNIRLNWDAVFEPGFFGYFIYRGTSAKNLELLDGPISTRSYLDTSNALSGRSEYYYSIVNQNLRQDTSVLSDIVSIKPERVISTTFPKEAMFYYANGVLNISWTDVRASDNAIESFVVQKKTEGNAAFKILNPSALKTNSIDDNQINEGVEYQYRVAAITNRGDTSEFSEPSKFSIAPPPVDVINIFYVRNIPEGVKVSWPEVEIAGVKEYNIYRRNAKENDFSKIGKTSGKEFEFVDNKAIINEVYVYYITMTIQNGRQGERGEAISLRRENVQ